MAKRVNNKQAKPPSSREQQAQNHSAMAMMAPSRAHESTSSTKPNVSYCKTRGHEKQEIEAACYQCAETFCIQCVEAHRNHYVIFFQDAYLKNNYD